MTDQPPLPLVVVGHMIHTTKEIEDDLGLMQIPRLWELTFFDESLTEWFGRVGPEFYGLYFGYDKDHPGAYSLITGVGATTLTAIPPSCAGVRISHEPRVTYTSPGVAPKCAIDAWKQVWADTRSGILTRTFTTDVEIYHPDDTVTVLVAGQRKLMTS